MVADNNQRPMRGSVLALGRLSASAPAWPRRRGTWLALITTLSISALAIAVAWPTPALPAGESFIASKTVVLEGGRQIEVREGPVFGGDVRDLPKAKRWKPGDPVREGPPLMVLPPAQKEEIPPQAEEARALSPHQRKGGSYGYQ